MLLGLWLSYAIKNQLMAPGTKYPQMSFLPFDGSLWHKGTYNRSFPCTVADYHAIPTCLEVCCYGIARFHQSEHSVSKIWTHESAPLCLVVPTGQEAGDGLEAVSVSEAGQCLRAALGDHAHQVRGSGASWDTENTKHRVIITLFTVN